MAKAKEPFNPFYALLVVVGVLFTISATLYGVVMLRAIRAATPAGMAEAQEPSAASGGLIDFMSAYGDMLLGAEILLLAVATFGAIATDRYWARRQEASAGSRGAPPE